MYILWYWMSELSPLQRIIREQLAESKEAKDEAALNKWLKRGLIAGIAGVALVGLANAVESYDAKRVASLTPEQATALSTDNRAILHNLASVVGPDGTSTKQIHNPDEQETNTFVFDIHHDNGKIVVDYAHDYQHPVRNHEGLYTDPIQFKLEYPAMAGDATLPRSELVHRLNDRQQMPSSVKYTKQRWRHGGKGDFGLYPAEDISIDLVLDSTGDLEGIRAGRKAFESSETIVSYADETLDTIQAELAAAITAG